MAGHSQFKNIMYRKGAQDAKRAKAFTKLIRELTTAARTGLPDPAANPRLRAALVAARVANMSKDTIERAIKRGAGGDDGTNYEEVRYEGYGPGGVAIIVEALTDNRNRTVGDIRAILSRGGGHMAADGAVNWMFHKKGLVTVKPGPTEDQVMEKALDAGAEDVISLGSDGFEVRTAPADLHSVASALEKGGLKLSEQKWAYLPQNTIKLEGDPARKMLRLMESLEENDDVQHVHANFEIDEKLMEELA